MQAIEHLLREGSPMASCRHQTCINLFSRYSDLSKEAIAEAIVQEDTVSLVASLDSLDSSGSINDQVPVPIASDLVTNDYIDWIPLQKFLNQATGNPLGRLQEYYQEPTQRRRLSSNNNNNEAVGQLFTNSFFDYSSCFDGKMYWRCVFTCPLTSTEYATGCVSSKLTELPKTLQIKLQALGLSTYEVLDGHIFVERKKAARQAAAMSALLDKICSCANSQLLLWTTAPDTKDLETRDNVITKPSCSLPTRLLKERKVYPDWVERLHHLGAVSAELSYYQKVSTPLKQDLSWLGNSCRVYCQIQVQQADRVVSIQGSPTLSRKTARHLALQRFEQEDHVKTPNKQLSSRRSTLAQSDSALTTFFRHQPEWAFGSFEDEGCYLYELTFHPINAKATSNDWVSLQMNLDADMRTRIGILFPRDIPCSAVSAEWSDYSVRVELRRCTHIAKLSKKNLELLKQLNCFSYQLGKQYGFQKKTVREQLKGVAGATDTSTTSSGRTYLLTPLVALKDTLEIDWCLVRNYVDGKPYQLVQPRPIGRVLVWCWALQACAVIRTVMDSATDRWVDAWSTLMLLMLGYILYGVDQVNPPAIRLEPRLLRNRLLLHRNKPLYLFSSQCGKEDHLKTKMAAKKLVGKLHLRYGVSIQYPRAPAIRALRLVRHDDFNDLHLPLKQRQLPDDEHHLLVPELVSVLPIPRDLLYILDIAPRFLPLLERNIDIHSLAKPLFIDPPKKSHCCLLDHSTNLVSFPLEADRLEFLGDAVLGCLLASKAASINLTLRWSSDEYEAFRTMGAKNQTLENIALQLGLPRLLHTGQTAKWRSIYQSPRHRDTLEFTVASSELSKIVESVIGACFLIQSPALHRLLEYAQFPSHNEAFCSTNFRLTPFILCEGVRCSNCEHWDRLLSTVRDTFRVLSAIRRPLQEGVVKLARMLSLPPDHLSETSDVHTLLMVALFHDLPDDDDMSVDSFCEGVSPTGLLLLANLRELLSFVGHYALTLMVTRELFLRNPSATAGDLTLLRNAALSYDTLAYIVVNQRLYQAFLHGEEMIPLNLFQHIQQSDRSGKFTWETKGGWFADGGLKEFRRRTADPSMALPQYPGIVGGTLIPYSKLLPQKDTCDAVYSLRAVVGALTMASGVEQMWEQSMRRLFLEVLLLSVKETIAAASYSEIVKNYRGKKNR